MGYSVEKNHRGTIFVEEALVLDQKMFPAEQFVLRVQAPKCAANARAGSFAHVTCGPSLPMRRPLSIMRVDPEAGWVDFLYKIVGDGLRDLSERRPGDSISVLGPIGKPFVADPDRPMSLLIGGGVGIPPMVFLAEEMARDTRLKPIVMMGSEIPFPFYSTSANVAAHGIPDGIDQTMPFLDELGVPCRLASKSGFSGCFDGFVTQLAETWLQSLGKQTRDVTVFACGPEPMLQATADLARRYDLPCQVSLEEYMACAVGGCAGCTVLVDTDDGPAMKRVCVDGPVFDAHQVLGFRAAETA